MSILKKYSIKDAFSDGLSKLKQDLRDSKDLVRPKGIGGRGENFGDFKRYHLSLKSILSRVFDDIKITHIQFDTDTEDDLLQQVVDAVKDLNDGDLIDHVGSFSNESGRLNSLIGKYSLGDGKSIIISYDIKTP